MKNLKKVLALVMAFAMAFTMMAGAAYTDQDDIQATDAVELLATLNVMTGKGDGMFHPNDTITRAEICRIIYTIRNEGNDNANAYADMQTSFQDLTSADDWAKGYIKHCQSVNLISGRDAAGTIFGPQDPVTGVELAVICLRVLGYDPAKAGIGGESWSTKTIGLASEAGLLKGVNMESVTGPCERQWAAQIMANMLDARTVRWSTDGDRYTIYAEDGTENRKVGREYMKLHTSVGTLISIDGGNLSITQNSSDRADSDPKGASLTAFTNVNTDYTELLGQKVKVLYSDGKANSVIGVYGLSGNTVYTVNASAVESDGDKVKFDGKSYTIESIGANNSTLTGSISTYYTSIDGSGMSSSSVSGYDREFTTQSGVTHVGTDRVTQDTVSGTTVTYHSNAFKAKDLFDDWNTSSAIMKFVDSDNNGRLDSVIITDYAAAEVTSATSTRVIAGKTYEHADHNIDEGISQGDWVSISYNRFDDCSDVKKLETTTGKLDGFKRASTSEGNSNALTLTSADDKDGNKVKFNEYRVDSTWFNHATDKDGRTDISTVRAGDNIEYILLNGTAWLMKRASAGSLDDVVDIAMVVNKENAIGGQQVKLQFFNDTTAVVDVDTYTETGDRVPYGKLIPGTLYEYSVSGGKYIFETLNNTEKDFYGDYTYAGRATYNIPSDVISGKTIDDKAKVILFKSNGQTGNESLFKSNGQTGNESDVITGRQLKNLKATQATVSGQAWYFTADVSGLNRVAALAMTVNTIPTGFVSNDYYGYILSDAIYSSGNSEISYSLLLETGETVTVYERSTQIGNREANTLIGYKSLAAADSNDKRYIDDVTLYSLKNSADSFGVGAITSVNNSQSTVEIKGYGKMFGNQVTGEQNVDRDIATDTVKFFVNTDEKTGETTGTVRTAMDYTTSRDMPDAVTILDDDGKAKVVNCLYLDRDGDDLEVIVVESGDRIFRGPENKEYGQISGRASLTVTPSSTSVPANSTAVINFQVVPRNFVEAANTTDGTIASGSTATTIEIKTAGTDGVDASSNFTVGTAPVLTKNGTSVGFTITPNAGAPAGDYVVTVKGTSNSTAVTSNGATIRIAGNTIGAPTLTFSGDWDAANNTKLPKAGDYPSATRVTATATSGTVVTSIKIGTADAVAGNALAGGEALKLVFTVTAAATDVFAENAAITSTWNGVAPVSSVRSDDGKTLTATYEYTVPVPNAQADGTNANEVNAKLESNDIVEASGVLTTGISVPANKTLVVADEQTTLSPLTGNGNVVFDGDIANASGADSLKALMGSLNKVAPTVAAGNNAVAIDDGLKLSGTGEVVVWNTGESFSDMAAATGSKTVTPVEIVFTATQAPVGAKIKATGTLKTAYNGSTTWPLRGAYSTGDGFEVTGTPGDTAQLMVGDNCASITFTITIPAVAPATEPTVTTYTFTF